MILGILGRRTRRIPNIASGSDDRVGHRARHRLPLLAARRQSLPDPPLRHVLVADSGRPTAWKRRRPELRMRVSSSVGPDGSHQTPGGATASGRTCWLSINVSRLAVASRHLALDS